MARRTTPSSQLSKQDLATINKAAATLAEPQGLWRTARTLAMQVVAPYSPALASLIPHYTTALPTMGVDGYWRCYVNPDFVQMCVEAARRVSPQTPCNTCGATHHYELAYLAGVIVHEADHMRRKHCRRLTAMGNKDVLGNIAADCELNDDLVVIFKMAHESNGHLPRLCLPHLPIVMPAAYGLPDGKLMEWYYLELRKMQQQAQEEEGGNDSAGDSDEDGDGDSQNQASSGTGKSKGSSKSKKGKPSKDKQSASSKNPFSKDNKDKPRTSDQPGFNEKEHGDPSFDECRRQLEGKPTDCGSGADGVAREWEIGEPNDNDPNSMGLSESETERVVQEVARRVKDAAARGVFPGRLAEWAESVLAPPKYNWKRVFSQTFRRAIATTHGYNQPTYRRFHKDCAASNYDVIAPASVKPVPNVHVILDTSGSMGRANVIGEGLQVAASECEGIAKSLGATMTVIPVDAHVSDQDIKKTTTIKNVNLGQGGGTDMRVGFEASAKRAGAKPSVIVVLTDGYTPWPEVAPKGCTVIIGVCGQYVAESLDSYPKWAKVVRCADIDTFATQR